MFTLYIYTHTYTYVYIYIYVCTCVCDMKWHDMIWHDMIWHDMIWYMVYGLHAYMQVCKWRCVCVHLCKDVMIVLLRGTYATVVPIYFVSETTLWAILRMAAGTLRLTKIRGDSPTHVGIAHKPIDIWTHWHSQKIWESVLGFSFRRCWGVRNCTGNCNLVARCPVRPDTMSP